MMKFPIINRLFPSYKWKVAAVIIHMPGMPLAMIVMCRMKML